MPNRYEREIEEILRNLEQPDARQGLGQRFSERLRRKSGPRMSAQRGHFTSFNFTLAEQLLIVAVIAALIAGGYEYAQNKADLFTAIVACIGVVCLALVALSHFLFRPRQAQSLRYGNVTITPLRRSWFHSLKMQWNLFVLKLRYRRKNEP